MYNQKPNEKVLTVKGLSKAFQLIKEGLQIINDEDSKSQFEQNVWNSCNVLPENCIMIRKM